jgi:tetratricopeptide (TPR) repeat protein
MTLLATLMATAGWAQQLTPEQMRAERHFRDGVELLTAERWEPAAEQFKAAVAIDPLMAWAHYNLGQCRLAQRRFVEAALAFEASRGAFQSLALATEGDRAARERARVDEINEINDSFKRGLVLSALTRSRMEERLRTLESMANRDLDVFRAVPAEVHLALGSAYFHQRKFDAAELQYLEAVRVNGKLGAAHNNLAALYVLTGRLDEAASAVEQAEASGFRVNPRLKADLRAARARQP